MPYKHKGLKIPEEFDRRVKISKDEHEYIKNRHKQGEAIRALARSYGVDKRTIQFIVYPERLQRARQLFKARRKDGRYYNKNKWRGQMKRHRRYKQLLKLKGILTIKL